MPEMTDAELQELRQMIADLALETARQFGDLPANIVVPHLIAELIGFIRHMLGCSDERFLHICHQAVELYPQDEDHGTA